MSSLLSKLKLSKEQEYLAEKNGDYAAGNKATQEEAPPSYGDTPVDAPSYTPNAATEAVPFYSATAPLSQAAEAELNSAFSHLNVATTPPPFPEPEHALVHLKLLFALHSLKDEVGSTDELFGIKDSSLEKVQDKKDALAALKEKRWSLYVARAVERFQEWWLKVLCTKEDGVRLTTKELLSGSETLAKFPEAGQPQVWGTANLPPLGKHIHRSSNID